MEYLTKLNTFEPLRFIVKNLAVQGDETTVSEGEGAETRPGHRRMS